MQDNKLIELIELLEELLEELPELTELLDELSELSELLELIELLELTELDELLNKHVSGTKLLASSSTWLSSSSYMKLQITLALLALDLLEELEDGIGPQSSALIIHPSSVSRLQSISSSGESLQPLTKMFILDEELSGLENK